MPKTKTKTNERQQNRRHIDKDKDKVQDEDVGSQTPAVTTREKISKHNTTKNNTPQQNVNNFRHSRGYNNQQNAQAVGVELRTAHESIPSAISCPLKGIFGKHLYINEPIGIEYKKQTPKG